MRAFVRKARSDYLCNCGPMDLEYGSARRLGRIRGPRNPRQPSGPEGHLAVRAHRKVTNA